MENYKSALVLSAVGDALGYKNGEWKQQQSGTIIMKELDEMGGLGSLVLYPDTWPVSDETIMHMATARALIEHGSKSTRHKFTTT